MRAINRSLFLPEVLRKKGWIRTEAGPKGSLRIAPDSPVDVAASGGIGSISFNIAGRNPGGVLSKEAADSLAAEILSYLRSLEDEAGAPVFSVVARPRDLAHLGLDHPNSGDIVVIAAGPTALRWSFPARESDTLFHPAEIPGQHGYDPDPELDGIFFHAGEGIQTERVQVFRSIDVSQRIAARAGLESPRRRLVP
jgi:predicted AlkP superfamily phosphohydrolase/phosphomutase